MSTSTVESALRRRHEHLMNPLFRLLGLSRAIILYVDPTGYERGRVLETCAARHFHVVEVFSPPFASRFSGEVEGVLAAPAAGEECTWAETLTGRRGRIVAVCCGSDDGLATAERLAAALTPRCSNGINVARRDKYLMHEALRAAGLRAAQQRVVSCWEEEGEPFVRELLAAPLERGVVCKPRRGQASIRVGLADSVATAGRQCRALLAAPVALLRGDDEAGSPSVLLQEELRGREWVVDSVSRDGEHKVVALWRYSKASLNGAPFVNLCDELRPANDADDEALMEYARRVLDALGVRWGPAHLEIKRPASGPVLVEANVGRWNGVDFKLLADACLGYNAYEATLDAFTDRRRWEALPATPPPALGGAGR